MATRLVTLGGLRLDTPGAVSSAVAPGASRPRALALLAVLAAAGPAGRTRDQLCVLFWPEADSERARNGLSQLVFTLRRDLGGADVLLADPSGTLRLNPARVGSDVQAFEVAHAAKAYDHAVALYAGPFLDGFHLKDAPEFARWADAERDRLRSAFAGALEHLAAARAAAGDHSEAAARWRQRAALDPLSERVALALVRALADAGDVAAALNHGRAYEALVGQELGTAPGAAISRLVASLRATHPVPAAPATPAPPAPSTSPQPRSAEPSGAVPDAGPPPTSGARPPDVPHPAAPARAENAATGPAIEPPPLAVVPSGHDRTRGRRTPWRGRPAVIGAAVLVTAALATAALVSVSSQEFEGAAAGTVVTALAVRPFSAGSVDGALGASVARLVGDRLLDGMHPLLSEPAGRPRPAALEGTLGRTGRVLVAHAVLRDADGQPLAAADAQVSADSIGRLADQLTVVLLARLNGLPEAHQPDLAARALPAARAYLAAEVAYRRDRLEGAQRLYRDALAVDTTLALAALGLAKSGGLGWSAHARSGRHGDALAWRLAGRLSASDRVLFDAYRGRPDPASHTLAARLALWRDTYQRLPDRAEPAYEYASALYHSGGYVGDRAAAWALAAGLLRHAVALDSTWALPYAMLIPLTAAARDTAALRALEARYAALRPDPAAATYVRWRTGIALGDAARTTALRAALDTVRDGILRRVAGLAALDGTGLADADRAARVLTSRGNTPAARVRALALVRQYALNRGHTAEAEQAIAGLRSLEPLPLGTIPNVVSARQLVLSDALFGGERPERAEAAARDVAASTPPDRIPAPAARTVAQVERCLAGLWWLRTGQVAAARTALADARTAGPPRPEDVPADVSPALCAATLDAALAAATHARDALPRLARLDTLAASGPAVFGAAFVNRVAADLWAARGEPRRALVALRRRRYDWDAGPEYLAPALLQEASLAAALGDSAGARCALAHHLVLRDPTRPEVGRADAPARAMFARLAVAPPTATWAACRR